MLKNFAHSRDFFASPQPAGRKITAGFTYLQRISKAANFDIWFPDELKEKLVQIHEINATHFPAQWAAVRQFELLQESGNHKIYDLDPENMKRATLDVSRSMRAGGYRITVATIGTYHETSMGDELEILDHNLQERIGQMIHMLYLDSQSDEENTRNKAALADRTWDLRKTLPHIGMVLGARDLFYPADVEDEKSRDKKDGKKGGSDAVSMTSRKHRNAQQFFDILNTLPQNHIVHDTVIGLQLPELNGVNQWNYIAAPDETLAAFNRVIGDLFHAPTFHLRGYGDRLNESSDRFYRSAALALH